MSTLLASIAEAEAGRLEVFEYEGALRWYLDALWNPDELGSIAGNQDRDVDASDARFSIAEPERSEWTLAFTPAFRKSIAAVDKVLQGRILGAVSELSSEPLKAHGDTVKPLTGEFKGLWRYRVGPYRLIYRPAVERKQVVLLEFGSRGGAYE